MTKARPLIGVTASRRRGRFMWWCNRLAVWRAGGRAVRITADAPPSIASLDGLIVGGGDDIHPSMYGIEMTLTVRVDEERDRMEQAAVEHAMSLEKPVLGICRGAQMINVVRGGTLHTDIHAVYETAPRMRTALPRKRVSLDPRSRLAALVGATEVCVNALHHQSVDRPGEGLGIVGRDEHGIVQAVESEGTGFVFGVQWHPEFLILDSAQQNIVRALIAAAGASERCFPEPTRL